MKRPGKVRAYIAIALCVLGGAIFCLGTWIGGVENTKKMLREIL